MPAGFSLRPHMPTPDPAAESGPLKATLPTR